VEAVARRVQADGGFVVVNEVTTGVGRTGRWFGFQHYAVSPDAVALGKGIGGGYPVAVAAFAPRAAGRLTGPPAYAQSHQNDPLGAAVLLAVIRTIEDEGLIERARAVGERLSAGLGRLVEAAPGIAAVRARGSMVAVDLAGGPETARAIHRALLEAGFLVGLRPGTATLRIDPPLCVGESEIDGFLAEFKTVLS